MGCFTSSPHAAPVLAACLQLTQVLEQQQRDMEKKLSERAILRRDIQEVQAYRRAKQQLDGLLAELARMEADIPLVGNPQVRTRVPRAPGVYEGA